MAQTSKRKKNQIPIGSAASQMLTLEPRIMLDAAALVAGAEMVVDTTPTVADTTGIQLPENMEPKPDIRDEAKNQESVSDDDENIELQPLGVDSDKKDEVELVIVDKSIANYETLLAGLFDKDGEAPAQDRMIEVIEIEPDADGILQVTNALTNYQNIVGVHILSHADQGEMHLGSSTLNSENLSSYSELFNSWQSYLSDNADLLLYGCNIAEGDIGIEFVNELSALTNTDVAASVDLTGHESLGGDYNLEYQTGVIEVTNPLEASAINNWVDTLDLELVKVAEEDSVAAGDEINYLIFLQNTEAMQLQNVTILDEFDPNLTVNTVTTLVGPIGDSYETVTNTALQVTDAGFVDVPSSKVLSTVLANDNALFGGSGTVTGFDAVSTGGGSVNIDAQGRLSYTPTLSFVGVDTFTYTAMDPLGLISYTTTVQVTVHDNTIWYIDNSAAVNGDGRSTSPFNSFDPVRFNSMIDPDGPFDVIFFSTGSSPYDAHISLESNQTLHGEGVDLVLSNINLNAASTRPIIGGPTAGIQLSLISSTLQGFTVGDTLLAGITGVGGSVNINNVDITGNGAAVRFILMDVQATFDNISSTNNAINGLAIELNGILANSNFTVTGTTTLTNPDIFGIVATNNFNSNIDFGDTVITDTSGTAGGVLVNFVDNNGSIISFDSLNITTTANKAIHFQGTSLDGGTINFNSPAIISGTNYLDTLVFINNVRGTTNGIPGFTFQTINASNSAFMALDLRNLTDPFAVTGTGVVVSGGLLDNINGNAIYLERVQDVSFNNIQISNSTSPGTHGIFINGVDNLSVTNSMFSNLHEAIDTDFAFGGAGLTGKVTLQGNIFNGITGTVFTGSALQPSLSLGTQTLIIDIVGNTVTNSNTGFVLGSKNVGVFDGEVFFDIDNNNITTTTSTGSGVVIFSSNSNGVVDGVIHDNTITSENTTLFFGSSLSSGLVERIAIQDNTLTSNFNTIGMSGINVSINLQGAMKESFRISNNTFNSTMATSIAINDLLLTPSEFLIESNTMNTSTGIGTLVSAGFSIISIRYETNSAPLVVLGGNVTVDPLTDPDRPTYPVGFVFNPPLLALNGENQNGDASSISLLEANSLLSAAKDYWSNTTISPEVLSKLDGVEIQLVDLPDGVLGSHEDNIIYIDDNAANYGWFVDQTPYDSIELNGVIVEMDLLTVLMHEMGHVLGFKDVSYSPGDSNIMTNTLAQGVRVLPPQTVTEVNLDNGMLNDLVSAAVQRWVNAGITAEQEALLNSVTFEIADLPELRLAEQEGLHIKIDLDGNGANWFVDSTPLDNSEYAYINSADHLSASQASDAYGRYDLLTTIMHEMGHVLGLQHESIADNITTAILKTGERYLPFDLGDNGDGAYSGDLSLLQTPLVSGVNLDPFHAIFIRVNATLSSVVDSGFEVLTNMASATGDNFTTVVSNEVQTPVIAFPFLSIFKSDQGTSVNPGESIIYTINPTNTGSRDAIELVIDDVTPDFTTFDPLLSDPGWVDLGNGTIRFEFPTLDVGENFSTQVAFKIVDAVPADLVTITNDASISGGGNANSATSNEVQTVVDAIPFLSLIKSDDGTTAIPTESTIYTIDAQNTGNRHAIELVIDEVTPMFTTFDPLLSDPGWVDLGNGTIRFEFASLEVGEPFSAQIAFKVIDVVPADLVVITNTASVTGGNFDLATSNEVQTIVEAAPIFVLTKMGGVNPVGTGETVVYTFNAQNIGNRHAVSLVLEEIIPDDIVFNPTLSDPGWVDQGNGTIRLEFAVLDVGTPFNAQIAFQIKDVVSAGFEVLTNTATIADANVGPVVSNETQTVILARPDFIISKTDNGLAARPGDTIVYTINAENIGDQHAIVLTFEEITPQFTFFNPSQSAPGWVNQGDGTVRFEFATLNVGEPFSTKVAFTVAPSFPATVATITNTLNLLADPTFNLDANINVQTSDSTRIVVGNVILWARDGDSYYDAGRYDSLPFYQYRQSGQLTSLSTIDAIVNIQGARDEGRYDPFFGYVDFVKERIRTVSYASWPAIQQLLTSDIHQEFNGLTPYGNVLPENQVLINQTNHNGEVLIEKTADEKEAKEATDERQNKGIVKEIKNQQQSKLNWQGSYRSFSEQLKDEGFAFEQRRAAFTQAAANMVSE